MKCGALEKKCIFPKKILTSSLYPRISPPRRRERDNFDGTDDKRKEESDREMGDESKKIHPNIKCLKFNDLASLIQRSGMEIKL